MIFTLIILIVIGIIVFFHYTQGLWSATLSALIAVVSAILAVSYHETVVEKLLGGKVADYAHSMTLIGIFALSYFILRVMFDQFVPGNLRFPAIMDKVGGAVMGLIAAIFAAGVFALAAQAMPFGPSIGGYSRYLLSEERTAIVPLEAGRAQRDLPVGQELENPSLRDQTPSSLFLPVDTMVANFVSKLSKGSLATNPKRPLDAVHPSYVDELYAQRLGIQGGKHVVLPDQVQVQDIYRVESVKSIDAEMDSIRSTAVVWPKDPLPKMYLVMRLLFRTGAGDADDLVRISPGSIRLVAGGSNYHPIGTLQGGTLFSNKPDDFLFIPEEKAADFVFAVNANDVMTSAESRQPGKIKPGTFIEIKRMSRHDLSGKDVAVVAKPSEQLEVLRKREIAEKVKTSTGPPAQASPFEYANIDFSQKLFSPINVGTPEPDAANVQVGISGKASLTSGKLSMLDVKPDESLTRLREGSYAVSDLYAPDGQKLVLLVGAPPAAGADPWAWADELGQFAVTDTSNRPYPPHGAWAMVKDGTTDKMVAMYNASSPVSSVPRGQGRPLDVYLAFLVPSGTAIQDLTYKGQTLQTIGQQVP